MTTNYGVYKGGGYRKWFGGELTDFAEPTVNGNWYRTKKEAMAGAKSMRETQELWNEGIAREHLDTKEFKRLFAFSKPSGKRSGLNDLHSRE